MGNLTHIVETHIGYDRPGWRITEDFVRFRIELFHKFTLTSLKYQKFKNFHVFVQCGKRYKKLLQAYNWNPRVTLCFNDGKISYKMITSDFLAITRIDSDDMFRRDAMFYVDKVTRRNLNKNARTILVFKNNICWDTVNDMIVPHSKSSSPFFIHIFPKKIYQDWKHFYDLHFLPHGKAGDRQAIEMPKEKVCVIKHGCNFSLKKRKLPAFKLTTEQLNIIKSTNNSDYNLFAYEKAIWNREQMREILKDFGVDYYAGMKYIRDMMPEKIKVLQ